jgi:hypothetical protein
MSNTCARYSIACSDSSSTLPLLPPPAPLPSAAAPLLLPACAWPCWWPSAAALLLLPGRRGSWSSTASEMRSCSL